MGSTLLIPLRIRNPFQNVVYPKAGELEAVLDTGFSGFLFVPEKVFFAAKLAKANRMRALLADGSDTELDGAFASLEFQARGVTVDGLVQTRAGALEVLLGMDGIRRLFLGIDSCARRLTVEAC